MKLFRCAVAVLVLALTACSSRPPAPVVERSSRPPPAEIPADGLYSVRSGDTLHGIAFKYGLDFRDIAGWNNIRSPYVIYPDQVLRLRPAARTASVTTQAAPAPRTTTQAVPPPRTTTRSTTSPSSTPKPADPPPVQATKPAATPPPSTASKSTAEPSDWIWPTNGRVLRTFKQGDPTRNGLDIVGTEGQDVQASAAGEVVYSGNGLIGYGELIIVKHSDRMLSAYAHNRRRLVKEGDQVRQGQKIAELGRNDENKALLHFEIRRDGQPVDPMKYLPGR